MVKVGLSDYETELLRFFAKFYQEVGAIVQEEQIPVPDGMSAEEARESVLRLIRFKYVELETRGSLAINPRVIEAVEGLDTPPPEPPPAPLPDYRDKLSKWFWSKPWSIGVYVLVVGLPAALGYVVMAKTILEWTGIIKGSK